MDAVGIAVGVGAPGIDHHRIGPFILQVQLQGRAVAGAGAAMAHPGFPITAFVDHKAQAPGGLPVGVRPVHLLHVFQGGRFQDLGQGAVPQPELPGSELPKVEHIGRKTRRRFDAFCLE